MKIPTVDLIGNMQSFGTALQNFQNFRFLLRKIDTLLLSGDSVGFIFRNGSQRITQFPRMLQKNPVDHGIIVMYIIHIIVFCTFTAFQYIEIRMFFRKISQCQISLDSHGTDTY